MIGGEESVSPGRQLFDRGWRQGALLSVPPAQVAFISHELTSDGHVDLHRRNVRQADCLVVVSQDCDIVARDADEPCVEALICAPENEHRRRQVAFRSRRYFVIDDPSGLVARAAYRIFIRKDLALSLPSPERWPSGETRLQRFVRWLGDRYTRPPLPDAMVEHVQRPIDQALAALEDADPDASARLSSIVPELRITLPSTDDPPYGVTLIVMIESLIDLTADQADALDQLDQTLRVALTSPFVILQDVVLRTEHDLSVADFRGTAPIYREHLTYRGDDVLGSEPITGT